MAQETIEVTINPDGRVEIHVVGIAGMACTEVTSELTRILGNEVISQEMTAEAYQDEAQEQGTQQWH